MPLIDTGCMVNLVYRRAYEEMDLREKDRNGSGELRGIGNLRLPIIAKFREALKLGGLTMNESEIMVLDREGGKYEAILGYEFLKVNEIIIDTKRKVLKKVEGNGIIEFYLGSNWKVKTRRLYGVDVTAE